MATMSEILGPGGVISHRLPGYESRPAQVAMAETVATALETGRHAVIEGGTGVGKALDVDTPIATPTGWKRMGDLCAGDMVFDARWDAHLGATPRIHASLARSLGVITIVCTVLYSIPPTSILGAILLTGYLGGAMASHVRIGSPLFTHTLFGLYLGLMVWGGLWLRDRNLQTLIPFRR